MRILSLRHITTYRYAKPVVLGDHRLMLRPRDSHDLRLLETRLTITPEPAAIRWMHDVFSNSVAVVSFASPADLLSIESAIRLDHFESSDPPSALESYAETYPFSYSADDVPDLNRSLERHYPDPEHEVDLWAKRFLQTEGPTNTLAMLVQMTKAIKADGFTYAARAEEGCQAPVETLRLRSGSCRDFALLMMEAVRSLGLAARFVSGYIYVPGAQSQNLGGGATHAWLQIYLPGAGWMEFDPTNGIVGNRDLIRVAVVRDPSQAIPVTGSWTGAAGDFRGMEVDIQVTAET
ncbi:MAG TPA: transglutaminase family protein [Candidatus Binataceae bacterium]|nr:transglutaminase family protein [Candidatus Binataceae bacterium]